MLAANVSADVENNAEQKKESTLVSIPFDVKVGAYAGFSCEFPTVGSSKCTTLIGASILALYKPKEDLFFSSFRIGGLFLPAFYGNQPASCVAVGMQKDKHLGLILGGYRTVGVRYEYEFSKLLHVFGMFIGDFGQQIHGFGNGKGFHIAVGAGFRI